MGNYSRVLYCVVSLYIIWYRRGSDNFSFVGFIHFSHERLIWLFSELILGIAIFCLRIEQFATYLNKWNTRCTSSHIPLTAVKSWFYLEVEEKNYEIFYVISPIFIQFKFWTNLHSDGISGLMKMYFACSHFAYKKKNSTTTTDMSSKYISVLILILKHSLLRIEYFI